ncbi:hypothetical protein [uncultured Megasphaera sp.]|uniref:hypothetical protein n=1 Tax=uncultured Megasphaera sp. TaxID=165188 RepID=UPI00345D2B2E
MSQKLEQLVNQTGGEVLKAILEQADAAIYAAIKPEHRYQVKVHRSRTLRFPGCTKKSKFGTMRSKGGVADE